MNAGAKGANPPTLADQLLQAYREVLVEGKEEIELSGALRRIGHTRRQGLRTISFAHLDHAIEGIEQNPETTSRWAKLAREGLRIMQFSCQGRYIANVCEGRLTRYPAWRSLGLPE